MPSQGQDRTIRKVLLELLRESSVELPQDNADLGVGVTREQRRMEVQLIIRRQCEDRRCVTNARAVECFRAVGSGRRNKHCTGRFNGAGEVGIAPPQHDDAMALQRTQLAGCVERYRATADHDQQ